MRLESAITRSGYYRCGSVHRTTKIETRAGRARWAARYVELLKEWREGDQDLQDLA